MMLNLFKRLRRKLFGEEPSEPTELDLSISPTEVPGMYLINGTRTRIFTSPRDLAFRGRVGTADME